MKTTPQSRRKSIIQLVVLYAVMSGAWIFLSDILLTAFFSANVEQFKEYSILKGLFFVGTTSGMFYFFCMKWQRHLERVETNLELNALEVVTGKTKYARIFEVANEALFIIDRDTLKFLEVNESACVMYGYIKNDFLHSLSVLDMTINPESSIKSINSETIRVEYALHKKIERRSFSGRYFTHVFLTDDQRLIAASVRNMTTHYELVNSLKSNEQKYIDAQLMGNVGNWTWDLRTQSVIWSPGLYKIYGITPTELP
ncbi:MAG: PAS domain-containing protein [Ignavibacteria bacterium]|nr:PAS domain-containing protein [Ignavibacteria bacterium]